MTDWILPQQPDQFTGKGSQGQPPQDRLQRFAIMHRPHGVWLGVTGDEEHGFICEIELADGDSDEVAEDDDETDDAGGDDNNDDDEESDDDADDEKGLFEI